MSIRIVQSKQNARLKELRKALAHPGRNERGLVGIEGPNLVGEALRTGVRVECLFAGGDINAVSYQSEAEIANIDILVVPGDALKSILGTESPQLVAALVEPPDWTWAHLLGDGKEAAALIVVLAGLQDPGNLGTILRSAEAFGANGVLCLEGTVSEWNPKAVRASAGSVFRMPVLRAGEREAMDRLREAGVRVLATAVKDAQPVDMVDLSGPVALVIGNEGNGVPADLTGKANGAVTIPCPGPVESLNAAVATSVLLYEAARQREVARQRALKSGGPLDRRGGSR